MGLILKGLVVLVILAGTFVHFKISKVPPVPKLEDDWMGPRDPSKEDTTIKPFKIKVSDEVLNDLKQRLDNALPFQEPLEGVKQHYGINTNLLKSIVDFWRTKYDWKEREKFLNQFPQYITSIQGLKIHFLHVKPQNTKGVKVLPLLLVHGWPGSIREFYELIPLLTTQQKGRDFVFEVIVPSLPGYGFSEAAVKPGLNIARIASIFNQLMQQRLKFEKFYVQGGDWGSAVVRQMATLYSENIIGMHSNFCGISSLWSRVQLAIGSLYPPLVVDKEEEPYVYPLTKNFQFLLLETGYMHLQATKPDTVGVALRDSPVGLAAYILEKFITWTNPAWKDLDDGGLTKKYTLTNLLDNVMIYWTTRSITTSMRLYAEFFSPAQTSLNIDSIPVTVPAGCARFTNEMTYSPKKILEATYHNLVHVSHNEGGHFAAFEVPAVLAKDIYVFVDKVEKLRKEKTDKKEL